MRISFVPGESREVRSYCYRYLLKKYLSQKPGGEVKDNNNDRNLREGKHRRTS